MSRVESATLAEADKRLKLVRTAHIKLRTAITRGEYVSRADQMSWRLGVGCFFKTNLRALAESLPAELDVAHRQDWSSVLESRFAAMCNNLAEH